MNYLKMIFVFVICGATYTSIEAQEWINFQSQGQVNDLVETDTELLLATDAGLVVINKITLDQTIFNTGNSKLPSNHIQTIHQTVSGDNWIGTYDMIVGRFTGTDFEDITTPDHPAINIAYTQLFDLQMEENGDLWIASNDGVFHRKNMTWLHYDEDELGPNFFEAWDIAIDDEGTVYVAGRDVNEFKDGNWSNLTEGTTFSGYLDSDLFFSSTGDLFLAGDLDKIGRYDGTQWQEYPVDFNAFTVKGFAEDADGNIFFFSPIEGIYKLENNAFVQQSNAQTIAVDNKVNYLYFDQSGASWLNSNIQLSVIENGKTLNTTISQHTIVRNSITNVQKGSNGNMYFLNLSERDVAVVTPDGEWSNLIIPETPGQSEFYNDLFVVADNDIWVLSTASLYHFDGIEWTTFPEAAGFGLATDSQGKIYIHKEHEIVVIDNGVFNEYTPDNSMLTLLSIRAMGIDAQDNLWIGTGDNYEENVIQKRSSAGIWTTYSAIEHEAIDKVNGDFHFDNDGNLWVPRQIGGALKFDGTDFTRELSPSSVTISNYDVFDIESDAAGTLYFAHQYGATILKDGVFSDNLIEDVPAIATSASSSICFDDEGNLWWANSSEGVFKYTSSTTNTKQLEQRSNIVFDLYPNPTKTNTTLKFDLAEKANVTVNIYNNIGQYISQVSLGKLPSGIHQENINTSNLSTGIYTLQILVNEQVSAKRLIVD